MAKRVSLSGNEAVAFGMKQINPDVVAAFPITPSTEVPQYFSQFVANGEVDTEFVAVESEHSAMSACIGAAAAGGRVMTATASAGLALMWEMLYVGASMRLPMVLAVTNRALSGPINIHNDHSDTMGARDSGWIQLYGESAQEAYDNLIQAIRIGEHKDVQLPVMVCYDGFITSHAVENLEMLDDEEVKKFVGVKREAPFALIGQDPVSMGPLDLPNHYFEHKRLQAEAMKNAKKVILEIAAEYEKLTGRKYGFFEEYKMEDAEAAIVVINSTAGTAKFVVDNLRAQGKKVGLIKIRVFRPFPAEELAEALKNVKAVAVMDKADSFSAAGGPLFAEVRSAMYGRADGKIVTNYIYGLGGRDVTTTQIEKVYADLFNAIETGKYEVYNYLGVRE
ncbi:2-ketoisovalerate ferredoxin oxidoreductase subunit alpha [Caloramator australicus]|uniref:Pyruvate:ferredoxin oxidoreductase, alpha subunit n=1 Tax=Caloramator australicus RC3 TaxID=857293 RepID=I7KW87_9CLOT|nr:2-ketoisovalerate ferredoxin oxidoreductase subunit alpha [Caloramator australicus]CCJ34374.1 Pyruvate:ferredoxin oxidoreductase, alpha subunit [Caloramator australicus RC3]